jgi:hypothetical protein
MTRRRNKSTSASRGGGGGTVVDGPRALADADGARPSSRTAINQRRDVAGRRLTPDQEGDRHYWSEDLADTLLQARSSRPAFAILGLTLGAAFVRRQRRIAALERRS